MYQNKLFFFVAILILTFHPSLAQKEKESIALKLILEQISEQHHIKFNYIEDEIVVFKLIPPPTKWALSSKIEYIKKETKLKFDIIDSKYYAIYNDRKVDKPLCGYLIDAESKKPIENARISARGANASTASNNQGYFELPVVSPNNIEIRHISYEPKEIVAKELYVATCPIILLQPTSLELAEVLTLQYLTSGISKKKDGTLEIKPKKLGLLPGMIEPDVLQTLQQVPGIQSEDETISNLNVRGGTHDQNLFLWNGIRMFQTGHFFGLISAFNPSLAHTISITRNGSSAFFGESVSSLVDISSHSKTIEENKNSLSTNLISAEFYSKIKLSEKASLEFSGRRSLTDFINTPTYQNYKERIFQNTIVTNLSDLAVSNFRSNENFYFFDGSLQYQQKIGSKHELTIDAITVRNILSINQFTDTASKKSELNQQNFGGNLGWTSHWNSNNSSQFHLSSSYYNLNATNEAIQNNQVFNQQNSVLDIGFQIKNTHQLSETLAFNNGYQFDQIGVTNNDAINTPAFSRNIKEVLSTHAGILEGIYRSPSQETYLNVGIRASLFSKFHVWRVEPRLQFNQAIASHLNIEILAEQKSQTLSQIIDLQQDFLGIEKRRWILANENTIPIQKSNQISIGLVYKNKNWLITLDNFFKKINGITTSSQGFQNQFEFIKASGDYNVFGTEILLQKKFRKFYSWISYSYNQNQYQFNSLSQAEFPNNFELVHAISCAFVYDWNRLKIALGSKWHTGKPITTPLNNSVNIENPSNPKIDYNLPNNSRLANYYQLNLSASRDWIVNTKITLQTGISVLNLLNQKNVINRFYRINSNQNTIESVDTYSLGRTPNLNIKVSF